MWEGRAQYAGREIAALAATGMGVGELHAAVIELVGAVVDVELTCWASMDPESLVISGITSGQNRIPVAFEPLLAEAEYSNSEPHRFAAMALRGETLSRSSDLPELERSRSIRFSAVWRPLGLDRELRVVFQRHGACWGAAGLVRTGKDFTDREVEFLLAVAPAITTATRLCIRSELQAGPPPSGPAIAVLDRDGTLCSLTPGARSWQERIDATAPGRFLTMMHVVAIGASGSASGEFRAKVRDATGRWAMLEASPLLGTREDSVAVGIKEIGAEDLAGLMPAAYGLTMREREICTEVLSGLTTTEIAQRLFISPNTVQDHLKSIFAKVSVHSRGQLAARMRPGLAPAVP
ncbi:LuxR C-terminal-related transcriptional regulator [Paeniglutamicibacter sp. ABSL32-1]|uniref:helix-turn-helix transcriptional regulator n=1 Tax=Paeniglutamicibacter quisquiliarum TaxID=2849498 RepID=UPI001C2CEA98|nr:LuxR C-terminal-related transcriptional regulator [Paeniglutamicibacter quisquiliarum]MBV1780842.1 LuxR C-terminal-related transcriptional regulator [Paeniglutamicibacter quisquiliarum]